MRKTTLRVERDLARQFGGPVAGVDEVGRGAIAGPVTVGVVLVDASTRPSPLGLRDSKELSAAARLRLVPDICAWAVAHCVGHASAQEVDSLGIMAALPLALARALSTLGAVPSIILIDGNVGWSPRELEVPVVTRVGADRSCSSVAAASVLAKVARDAIMVSKAAEYPGYGWERNAGYGTREHYEAIARMGSNAEHRTSWLRS